MSVFFFFNDTATTEIYTLSLHDALPISSHVLAAMSMPPEIAGSTMRVSLGWSRSEEHTSELQSPCNLVCRLLLEKKKSGCGSRGVTSPQLTFPDRAGPRVRSRKSLLHRV